MNSSTQRCRLIVLNGDASAVLTCSTKTARQLPEVMVRSDARLVEHISQTLLQEDTQIVSMFLLHPRAQVTYLVAEHWRTRSSGQGHGGWEWCLDPAHLEAADRHAFSLARDQVKQADGAAVRKPFARLGWFRELLEWIHSLPGVRPTGAFLQLNASASFSLIRFATDNGKAVWFKAVGPPNLRELPITLELATQFPSRLPALIAVKEDWNAWLAEEAPGKSLSDCEQFHWELAAQSLASVQIDSQTSISRFLAAGARDLRVDKLKLLIWPFLRTAAELMAHETDASAQKLDEQDLRKLGTLVEQALETLDATDMPACLGHLDPNPGNFILSTDSCRILDWAEAYIGHPFFTFEYLLQYHKRFFTDLRSQADLCTAYYSKWIFGFDRCSLISAAELIPMLAVFVYAAVAEDWTSPQIYQNPGKVRYYCSLVRKMWRLATSAPRAQAL